MATGDYADLAPLRVDDFKIRLKRAGLHRRAESLQPGEVALAIHEAAHATAAMAAGHRVTFVEIDGRHGGGAQGSCEHEPVHRAAARRRDQVDALIAMAPAAALRVTEANVRGAEADTVARGDFEGLLAGSDAETMRRVWRGLAGPGETFRDVCVACRRGAALVLEPHQRTMFNLAAALLIDGSLDEEAIRAIAGNLAGRWEDLTPADRQSDDVTASRGRRRPGVGEFRTGDSVPLESLVAPEGWDKLSYMDAQGRKHRIPTGPNPTMGPDAA